MVLFHIAVSFIGALITIIISYIIFRKKSVSIWGWVASFLPDTPVFWLATLGVTKLDNVMLITHTIGIIMFAVILVIIDILLLELAFMKYITWSPLPRYLRTIKRISSVIGTLEKYNAIPRPARVARVFLVTILAGVIHVIINILIGSL